MKKIIKIVALAFLVVIFATAIIYYIIYFGKPWWFGIYILSAITAFVTFCWMLRKLYLIRREKKFMSEILSEDQSGFSREDKKYAEELASRWKTAIGDIKGSHLKNIGNPLYVLPWYMIIGESGSGKTTAIRNSNLTADFAEPSRLSGSSGTKNCDWWFFEKAIILDTAGRYAISEDENRDRDEWHEFLGHLSKYRKKEPVNGLIVTVSADKLLSSDLSQIEEDGKKIRSKIEEMMHFIGSKCPVHVLITKCDLVQGMDSFCRSLPAETHTQAFGHLNTALDADAEFFLDNSFEILVNRLKELRLLVSYKPGHPRVTPEILLFPEEFEKLKPGLKAFFNSAFQQNVFQETSLVRGVFFTSAEQSGVPFSHFIDVLGVSGDKVELPATTKSMFLYDFFGRILPGDRHLHEPTQRTINWKRKMKTVMAVAWVSLFITLSGTVSYSFVKNLSIIKTARRLVSSPPVLEGNYISDISKMEELRLSIIQVQHRNKDWIMPRFGMEQSLFVETELKEKYCSVFRNDYLTSFDKILTDRFIKMDETTAEEEIVQLVPHVVRRVNLIERRLAGRLLPELKNMKQPDYGFYVAGGAAIAVPKATKMYECQYLHYLIWEKPENLTRELTGLRDKLKHFAINPNITLQWLVAWCNSNSNLPSILMSDYWGGNSHEQNLVDPAFTVKGQETIKSFLSDYEVALNEPLVIARKMSEYDKWYQVTYLNRWYEFGKRFPEGAIRLLTKDEKLSAAMRMGTLTGPYFALIRKMKEEIKPFNGIGDSQSYRWISRLYEYDRIQKEAESLKRDDGGPGDKSKAGKYLAKRLFSKVSCGKNLLEYASISKKNPRGAEMITDGESVDEIIFTGAEAFNEYVKALKIMSNASISPQAAYMFTSHAFGEDPAVGESPVFMAKRGKTRMAASLDRFSSSEEMISDLITGPYDFLWSFLCDQAGCHLQSKWESQVLSETEGIVDQDILTGLLWGKEGYVNKFVGGVAKPFIDRSRKKGFFARKVAGENLPFSREFFKFLSQRDIAAKTVKKSYRVKIKGMPTESNPNAQIPPHMTRIELEGVDGDQVLENYNYPIAKTFKWSPKKCGDVTLWIHIGDLKLRKRYEGFKPFARFLDDFKRGHKKFYRDDFPEFSSDLKRVGVEYIKVKFTIKGGAPIIRLLNLASGSSPKAIISCSE